MKRLLFAVSAVVALAGCVGPEPPPRDRYYRLNVAAPEARAAPLAGTLSVRPFDAGALLRERPILYSAGGRSHELQQYDYEFWTDAPPDMIQGLLVTYLRRAGAAARVLTPDLRARPDYEVSGRVRRLERLADEDRVAVELDLALRRTSDGALLVVDTFSAERPVPGAGVGGAVTAMSAALGDIFGRFLDEAEAARTRMSRRP